MYQQGWTNDRLGLASATAWTMFLIIVLAVGVNLFLARRRELRDTGRRRRSPLVGAAPEVTAR
jgi:cellobiose transport system permease protein